MAHAETHRQLVVARAGGACEYCRLVQAAAGVTFHIEHIAPRSQGGRTAMGNLALSCPGCNLAKAGRTTGKDRQGRLLGWHLHFVLERRTGLIVPRSPSAEATLETLRMNHTVRVFARKLQIQAGLIA